MTIYTTFRERVIRSLFSQKIALPGLAAFFLFSLPVFLKAQCPPDITVTGSTTGQWIAPSPGGVYTVEISATGAGGGNATGGNNGGGGANVIGTFQIEENEVLFVISGGAGANGSAGHAGGGGSGSGVVNCGTLPDCANGTVLIMAAGGNGGQIGNAGLGGSFSTSGSGAGGTGGGTDGGGGGGGLSLAGDDGGDGTFNGGAGGSQVVTAGLASGGNGSQGSNDGGMGMGGGGGGGFGSTEGSGGGAGHDGAPGGNVTSATSFNSGANQGGMDGGTGTGANIGSVIVRCLGFLPVKLIHFKAFIQEGGVQLIWSTATEKDNRGFDIERSADNRNWAPLGFVNGNGTSAHRHDYTFSDNSPMSGVNYYRLKQLDFDGKHEYSHIIVADLKANTLQFDVFPNPSADGALTFRTVSQQEGDALLEIWDWAGYKVWKETQHLWEGTTVWPVSMVDFPKGAYSVRLQMPDGTTQFRKIVLQ